MVMILVISLLILVVVIYCWLWKNFKKELSDNDFVSLNDEIRIGRLERKVKMNEQMINWLWEQVAKEKLKEQKKGKGNK